MNITSSGVCCYITCSYTGYTCSGSYETAEFPTIGKDGRWTHEKV